MATYLKEGISQEEARENDAKVRQIVEDILGRIESEGDAAVRDFRVTEGLDE